MFEIEKLLIQPIHTPGHLSDHLCFLVTDEEGKKSIFTGDHIVGASSTFF
jgi:glyoxylase-like metal-dependent hydrolase (beta-lactamase superfamily II)